MAPRPKAYILREMPQRAVGSRDYQYHRTSSFSGRTEESVIDKANSFLDGIGMFLPNALVFEGRYTKGGKLRAITVWIINGSDPARSYNFSPYVDTSFNYEDYGGDKGYAPGGPYMIETIDGEDEEE